jgi:hypothetical protein
MDLGNAPRVTGVAGVNIIPRSDVVAAKGSVTVELPPEQTVQSAGEAVRIEIRTQDRQAKAKSQQQVQVQARSPRLDERITIEPQTHTVVLEKTDPDTGRTISQLPDETLLKLRIFSRQLAEQARGRDEANAKHDIERTA